MKIFLTIFFIFYTYQLNSQEIIFSNFADLNLKKANGYMDIELWDKALPYFKKAFEQEPNNINTGVKLAQVYKNLNMIFEADSICDILLGHQNVKQEVYAIKYEILNINGKTNESFELMKKGIANVEIKGILFAKIGNFYYEKKDLKTALEYWEKGILNEPNEYRNYYYLGSHFASTNEKYKALILLEMAIYLTKSKEVLTELVDKYLSTFKSAIVKKEGKYMFDIIDSKLHKQGDFGYEFNYYFNESANKILEDYSGDLYLEQLYKIRINFIEYWILRGLDVKFPNALFDFYRRLSDESLIKMNTFLTFDKLNMSECQIYLQEVKADRRRYIAWYGSNSLKVDSYNLYNPFDESIKEQK